MKAWKDVESKYKLFSTMISKYFIGSGVRIERFNNGRITVQFCYHTGDNFTELSDAEIYAFEILGWDQGVSLVNMNYYKTMMETSLKRRDQAKTQEEYDRANKTAERYNDKLIFFKGKYELSLLKQE